MYQNNMGMKADHSCALMAGLKITLSESRYIRINKELFIIKEEFIK